MRPRYSPIRPTTISCTPASTSTATISDAQPCGGLFSEIASATTMMAASAPSRPKAMPNNVAKRSGITEKFRNIDSHSRNRRDSV